LAPGIEQPLDRLGHRVESQAELGELTRSPVGRASGEITGGELA
jgi:hypothetical protein